MKVDSKWNMIPLEEVVEICDALRKPINAKERLKRIAGKNASELYPYYGATGQVGYIDDYITDGEYVLLGEDGAPFLNPFAHKAYIINGKTWVNNHAHILKSKTNNRFLCYYLNYFNYNGYVSGTTRLKLTQNSLKQIPVPVPSLDEQQRIVTKIEELFSKLDKGVEELNKVKEQLKLYRQAVLKEAFDDISANKTIQELSEIVTSGSRGWAKHYADKGARFVRITDMTREGIELKNDAIQFVNLPENVEGCRSKLQSNDVLVSITADLGCVALVPTNIGEAYINQHIAMIRFSNSNQGRFMSLYLKSEHGQKDLLKNKRGAGKLGLGLEDIRNTKVPDIDDLSAKRIVGEIDDKLSVCDKIEQTVNESLQKAESLRQSILKQAFEGKLV